MKKFTFAALVSIVFLACNDDKSEAYDASLKTDSSFSAVTPVVIADTLLSDTSSAGAGIDNSTPNQPLTITNPATTSTITPAKITGASTSGKSGINPAHGQPGHRCDIAVGAPLNSPAPAASKTAAPQVISTPAITPSVNPATKSPVISSPAAGGKINPPHGEPGHDCAVQVGAPLKGK